MVSNEVVCTEVAVGRATVVGNGQKSIYAQD